MREATTTLTRAEAVFYPQVREADATLVERCEDEHEQAKDMIAQLKRMNEDDPQFDEMFRQLVDSVTRHIDTEEHELFPRVEQANLDLNAIGRQMQAFEASMLGTRQRGSSQPGIQQ
jgi:hemerythrin-like domain-containing protein